MELDKSDDARKRRPKGDAVTFFPGISPQVVTHADPPFPAIGTQPLPSIIIPIRQEYVSNTLK